MNSVSSKKSQITVFIIIGILLIAVIMVSVIISNSFQKGRLETEDRVSKELSLESEMIKENIDTCVETLTDRGMRIMAKQGFYLDINPEYQYDDTSAYWLIDTINVMPSRFKDIQAALGNYIDSKLPGCVSFDKFEEMGWEISEFMPVTSVEIYKEDIGVDVDYTIVAAKRDFTREFSDTVHVPKIRFRKMYEKAVDLMNNQLLRPDFDVNDPFMDYDMEGYIMENEMLDGGKTILFSIKDGESKWLGSEQFTLRFVASFDTNKVPRTYAAGSQVLFSPDRLAMLIFPSGSPAKITVGQYEADSVTRLQTPHVKVNSVVTQYVDTSFSTKYPIYRF
ncbi:MAG: hypothetical protein KAK00_10320, partial [Nanoarchaeota archaeon]|nr:hypothetical protein [Nanoarchaeota archaeon]